MVKTKLQKILFRKRIIQFCMIIYMSFFLYIIISMIIHMILSVSTYYSFYLTFNYLFLSFCILFGLGFFGSLLSNNKRKEMNNDLDNIIHVIHEREPSLNQEQKPVKIFEINEYIVLKLENNTTKIYVNGKEFRQCKYLLLDIKIDETEEYDEINSIDDISEKLDHSFETSSYLHIGITPEQEFQAHCSNIQAWVENNYNTRILHSNISFPLLRQLTELGDIKAKKVFKEEVVMRYIEGNKSVRRFLNNDNYLGYFNIEEILIIVRTVLEKEKSIDLSVTLNENIENDLIFSREDIEDISGIWKVIND